MDTLALVAGSLAGIAALGVLAELAARAWLARAGRYYVWTPHARTRMALDRSVFPRGDELVRFEVNRLGERGAPLPRDLSRTYRVLVSGGSAAECYFLDQPSSWPEALGRELSGPAELARLQRSTVHVGNVARSLADCRQLAYMFSKILPHYPRSDVIVLFVGASDLVRWMEDHTPAHISDEPVSPDTTFARHPEGPFGWTPSRLALRRIASAAHKSLVRPIQTRETGGKRLAANRAMRASAAETRTTIADPAPMLANYERNLTGLVRQAKAHAGRVLLVRQPWLEREFSAAEELDLWMFGDGKPYKEQVRAYYEHRLVWSLLRRIDEVTVRVARAEGVEALELHSRVPRDFEHYYDELHHTPKGCALVGRLVAEAILSGSGPSGSRPTGRGTG